MGPFAQWSNIDHDHFIDCPPRYEQLVPRYKDRGFHFTRVLNKFQFRDFTSSPMGIIEFIDRPGELKPAGPVGEQRRPDQHQAAFLKITF